MDEELKEVEVALIEENKKNSNNGDKIEFKPGKVALVTISTTLACILFLSVIILSFMCLITPITLTKWSIRLGFDVPATYFARASYEKTDDINHLGLTVERSVISKSNRVTAEYAIKLIDHPKYAEFVIFKDSSNEDLGTTSYDNFVKGSYVYSVYKIKEKDVSFNEMKKYQTSAYMDNCPATKFVQAFCEDEKFDEKKVKFTKEDVVNYLLEQHDALKEKYEIEANEESKILLKSYLKNVCIDLHLAYSKIGNPEKANQFEKEAEKYM